MGYVDQNLMPGEQVVYQAQLHWVIFLRPIVALLLALASVFAGAAAQDSGMAVLLCLGGLFFAAAIVSALDAGIVYLTTEFALNDERVIAKTGLIRRRSLELLLAKVESIGVYQPILGRILNYGTITVTGTGGTREPFRNIAAPLELRKRVHALLFADSNS